MKSIIVAGAGKIGSLIATLLLESGDYKVTLMDLHFEGGDVSRLPHHPKLHNVELDITNEAQASAFLKENPHDAVISSLPFFCNVAVAKLAREFNLHYFDLTEDTKVTEAVKNIAKDAKTAFVPQCGLAPGFISIAAHHLMKKFDSVDTVKMRVGALPENTSNALKYSLTWSTDGLINEYGNACYAIEHGKHVELKPLDGLEDIEIDGVSYEAFNTSGGLGSLAEMYEGKVQTMNYRTIRYPGHCDIIRLLMNTLKLNDDRETLKKIFENAIPKTYHDVVLVYVSVEGKQKGTFIEENRVYKIYPRHIAEHPWSAIQVTTAAGICAVLDLTLREPHIQTGFVFQENIDLKNFLNNRFGKLYLGREEEQ